MILDVVVCVNDDLLIVVDFVVVKDVELFKELVGLLVS